MNLGPHIHVLRFDKKSFFNKILGFTPYWASKSYGNEYYSEKKRNLSTINKIHLKCDCFEGSVTNDVGQPILYKFNLDKPPGYEYFCEFETIHYKKQINLFWIL